jgi:hypothetical protein
MKKISKFTTNFIYICTHASPRLYQTPFEKVTKILERNNCSIIEEFDCIGENKVISLEKRMEMIKNYPPKNKRKHEKI